MLNPGSYKNILEISGQELLKNYTLFATHTAEGGKRYYNSVLISRKDMFQKFCSENGLLYSNQDTFLVDSTVSEFLKSGVQSIGLTHSNSMSGCLLPSNYFLEIFNLKWRELDSRIEYSGNHTNSVNGVLNEKYDIAPVFDGAIPDAELSNFVFLYISPNIPYNSYWCLKSEEKFQPELTERFVKLGEIFEQNGVNNKLKVDGWEASTLEEYEVRFANCRKIVGTQQPRPLVQLIYNSEIGMQKGTVINHIKPQLDGFINRCELWQLYDSSMDNLAADFQITISPANLNNGEISLAIYFSSKKVGMTPNFNVHIDPAELAPSLNGGYSDAFKRILTKISSALTLELKVHSDVKYGLFIWTHYISKGSDYNLFVSDKNNLTGEKRLAKINSEDYKLDDGKMIFLKNDYKNAIIQILPKI